MDSHVMDVEFNALLPGRPTSCGSDAAFPVPTWYGSVTGRVRGGADEVIACANPAHPYAPPAWLHGGDRCVGGAIERVALHGRVGHYSWRACHWTHCVTSDVLFAGPPEVTWPGGEPTRPLPDAVGVVHVLRRAS